MAIPDNVLQQLYHTSCGVRSALLATAGLLVLLSFRALAVKWRIDLQQLHLYPSCHSCHNVINGVHHSRPSPGGTANLGRRRSTNDVRLPGLHWNAALWHAATL